MKMTFSFALIFLGLYCQTYANPCALVTCTQGTCVMLANSSFLCLCPAGRSGQYCEIIDPCFSTPGMIAPCRNGGTCVRLTASSYTCTCPVGFTGTACDIANPCSSMPCASNATCATLLNGSAICICPVGMTGSSCNQTISSSFCASSPCGNNGTCNGTTCICPNNTTGTTCNTTKIPCPTTSRPTLACSNGGTCVAGYGCFCNAGFAGDGCDTPISTSVCSPNPCQNNGTCIPSGTTGYVCVCPSNFTGPQCNLVTNSCLYSPCKFLNL